MVLPAKACRHQFLQTTPLATGETGSLNRVGDLPRTNQIPPDGLLRICITNVPAQESRGTGYAGGLAIRLRSLQL